MVRGRAKKVGDDAETPVTPYPSDPGIDVNAVVSYNLKAIRERRGLTQEAVAGALARLTGHQLPQASISAMERGFDGERRRRFDAHELYLLSVVFDVPIVYFFMPPGDAGRRELADTRRPISELYASILGREDQLAEMDQRLADLRITNPEEVEDLAAALFGGKEAAARNWHAHYRTWRKKRLVEISRMYGDRLDEVAAVLSEFARDVTQLGPKAYLQSLAHKDGEDVDMTMLSDRES
jgi:transcriptional regulator with XRE-family HTH domain